MNFLLYYSIIFIIKIIDNALGTTKTLFIQRNKGVFAGVILSISTCINYFLTKLIVTDSNNYIIFIVSIASGLGCFIAIVLNNKFSKDRLFINVIMCDDINAMEQLRDFLASKHITNVASDSYTKSWDKTITITAYAETKNQSRLIDNYLNTSNYKYKRIIN